MTTQATRDALAYHHITDDLPAGIHQPTALAAIEAIAIGIAGELTRGHPLRRLAEALEPFGASPPAPIVNRRGGWVRWTTRDLQITADRHGAAWIEPLDKGRGDLEQLATVRQSLRETVTELCRLGLTVYASLRAPDGAWLYGLEAVAELTREAPPMRHRDPLARCKCGKAIETLAQFRELAHEDALRFEDGGAPRLEIRRCTCGDLLGIWTTRDGRLALPR